MTTFLHTRVWVLVSILATILSACGGGGGGSSSGSSTTTSGASSQATSFSELIDNASSNFTPDTIARWREYDHSPSDYPNVINWAHTNNIINGSYIQYAQPGYGYPQQYPTPMGQGTFSPSNHTRELNYSAVDYQNGSTMQGQFQTFFGVKDATLLQNGALAVPILILTRGVVQNLGASADSMQVLEGYLVNYSPAGGPAYNGTPGSLFVGEYKYYILTAISNYTGPTGLIVNYNNYLSRN